MAQPMASLGGRIFCGLASATYDQSQGNIFVVAWPVQSMAGLWGHLLGGLASVTYGQLRGHVAGVLAGATCGGVWRMLLYGLAGATNGDSRTTNFWQPGQHNLRQPSRNLFLAAWRAQPKAALKGFVFGGQVSATFGKAF